MIRPDILVRGKRLTPSGSCTPFAVALDTKWKLLMDNSPSDEDLRCPTTITPVRCTFLIDAGDLRLMFAYKSYLGCTGQRATLPQGEGIGQSCRNIPLPSEWQ